MGQAGNLDPEKERGSGGEAALMAAIISCLACLKYSLASCGAFSFLVCDTVYNSFHSVLLYRHKNRFQTEVASKGARMKRQSKHI